MEVFKCSFTMNFILKMYAWSYWTLKCLCVYSWVWHAYLKKSFAVGTNLILFRKTDFMHLNRKNVLIFSFSVNFGTWEYLILSLLILFWKCINLHSFYSHLMLFPHCYLPTHLSLFLSLFSFLFSISLSIRGYYQETQDKKNKGSIN